MVRGTFAALGAALVMYVWGFGQIYSPDVGELCAAHGESWDWREYHSSWIPLSRTCNARFDLVPSFVNPTICILLAVAVVLAVLAVVKRLRWGKT